MRELTEEDTDVAELIDIDEWFGMCHEGELEDCDGYGYRVFNEDEVDESMEIVPSDIFMSDLRLKDDDLTHILWYPV